MKKIVVVMMVLSLLIGVVGCSKPAPASDQAAAPEEKFLIRAGIGLNDQHPQFKALEVFKEKVEKDSNGRIEVQLFHSSQLGDDREMMEALQMGSQEMTCPSTAPIAPTDKRFMIFDLPFLFPNAEIADQILDGDIGQELLDGLQDHGLIGLSYWENGYRHLTNSVRAVQTPADMKGLKIRTMENPVHLDFFRALGANPTPMPFAELFTAMQQGVVDGQENPVPTIYLQKFAEVQKHTSLTGHVYSPFVLLMSKKFYDKLPADLQEVVQASAFEARDFNRKLNREYTQELVSGLREQGMTVTELTKEQQQMFQDATKDTVNKFKDEIGAELVENVLAEVKRLSQ